MTRDEAVARIKRGLGFRTGTGLDDTIVDALQEAQDDLEQGKTLPKFLLVEDEELLLAAGAHTVAIPEGFLRESDETRIRFYPPNSTLPTFLSRRFYIDAVQANIYGTVESDLPEEPVRPSVYVVRQSVIDFIATADQAYTLYWDYYQEAAVLAEGTTENVWLADKAGKFWLIGEAGLIVAKDLRQPESIAVFERMVAKWRAAVFAEVLAAEEASGPLVMGANQ